jgi:hypothetical protein
MLILILFVGSICSNDAHEEVQKMSQEAMEERQKKNAKA